jgi:hypothetical protein
MGQVDSDTVILEALGLVGVARQGYSQAEIVDLVALSCSFEAVLAPKGHTTPLIMFSIATHAAP